MEVAANNFRQPVEQQLIAEGSTHASAEPAFSSQEEFSVRVNSQLNGLEQQGLIDQESADFLRDLTTPSGKQVPLSYSNPMSALVVTMLDLAMKTQSQVNVESIDLANLKVEISKDLAKDLVSNAAVAFGVTVVGGFGSLAVGYKAGQLLGKPGKGGMSSDPESATWAPIATNMAFQISSAGVEIVKSTGQAGQMEGQADLDRYDQILQLFSQSSNQLSGQIDRLSQQ